jgi:hypothetical protein
MTGFPGILEHDRLGPVNLMHPGSPVFRCEHHKEVGAHTSSPSFGKLSGLRGSLIEPWLCVSEELPR